MAVSKQPSITPETSSGEGLDEEPAARGETKWKRFHPLRVVRKIFRRRVKRQGSGGGSAESSKKSWSTSELQSVQEPPEKYEVPSPPYKIGLSVSHDSIFSPESSNLVGSEELNRPPGSSLSVQHAGMKNMFKDELFSRVHARRDSDDDDIGLPHSPCTSPTTVDVLNQGLKAKPFKSGSLSVGSLISTGSSENDEDSAVASSSGNSSRMSLLDRRSLDFEVDPYSYQPIPLNHNAAHHKIAVRPKRTHGLPQKRLKQQLAATRLINLLPTTPEVIEDNGRLCVKSESVASGFVIEEHSLVMDASVEKAVSRNITEITFESANSKVFSQKQEFVEEMSSNSSTVVSQTMEDVRESSLQHSPFNSQDISVEKEVLLKPDILKNNRLSFSETASSTRDVISKECFQTSFHESTTKTTSLIKPDVAAEKMESSSVDDTPLCVSAMIKNLERSDSLTKRTKDENGKILGKQSSAKGDSVTSTKHAQITANADKQVEDAQNSVDSKFDDSSAAPATIESQIPSAMGTSDNVAQKSLSPIQLQMEIRQQFQHQKAAKGPQLQQNHRIARSSQEEESIMSTKSLVLQPKALRQEPDNSHVTVSHQITESHNLVTVDKSFKRNRMHTSNSEATKATGKESLPRAVSASQDSNVSNLMVNSGPTFEQKVVEEKVTISICSKSENDPVNKPSPKYLNNEVSDKKSQAANKPSEVSRPLLRDKTTLLSKNVDPSKRVSVEIIPFNQRMKDKKYQPLSYIHKGADKTAESSKDTSPGAVERNVSERRSGGKHKDLEKANNRHSFSGPLSLESEKPSSAEKKPIVKSEKVHYPVQIRIHNKNKTYEKENHFEKTKIRKSTSPEPTNDKKNNLLPVKVINDNKNNVENHSNWEVKVHSTSLSRKDMHDVPKMNNIPAGHSSIANENSSACQSEEEKSTKRSPSNSVELSAKNQENVNKSSQPKNSEPELFRVFARRSIKQKHHDKDKPQEQKKEPSVSAEESPPPKPAESSSTAPPPQETNAPKPQKNSPKSPDVVKRKSKSFNEKEKLSTFPLVTPLKEVGLNRRQSLKVQSPETGEPDNFHRRQRIASEPDILPTLPPGDNMNGSLHTQNNLSIETVALSCRSQSLSISPSSTLSNGSSSFLALDSLKNKDNSDRDGPQPSWLQLAQQRREMREQRERLLIGSTTNTFLDASSKPSRSSKVWDMVNNFQKLQMT